MTTPHPLLHYPNAMNALAEIAADRHNPNYVRTTALRTIVNQVSPIHPKHNAVLQALGLEPLSQPLDPANSNGFVNGYPTPETQREALLATIASYGITEEDLARLEAEDAEEDEEAEGAGEEEPP